MVLGDTLKKVLLAGVGTVAATAEKGRELIDDMAKKGEITVEQSSILKKDIPENIQNLTSTIKSKVSKVTSTDFNAIIDKLGLDDVDQRYLRGIIERFKGGPVGVEALANSIAEETTTLEDVYEPYLLKLGFIARTTRGRIVLPVKSYLSRKVATAIGIVPQ